MFLRDDVYGLPHDPRARGHEQRGRRLGVVLQSEDLALSTIIVAPTSPRVPERVFRPRITAGGASACVLIEQLRAVDTGRLGTRVGHVSRAELDAVDEALELVLGLDLRRAR